MSAPALVDARDVAIHATGVAIGGRALLILGPSRAGKSRTAAALIRAGTARRPIRLIGDDRLLLGRRGDVVVARPHPRIAGFMEVRGLGLVAAPFAARAPVAGVVVLSAGPHGSTPIPPLLHDLPRLLHVYRDDAAAHVLAWWRDACTTHPTKSSRAVRHSVKD